MFLDKVFQFIDGAVLDDPDGAFAFVQDLGNLFVVQIVKKFKLDYQPLFVGEPLQSSEEFFLLKSEIGFLDDVVIVFENVFESGDVRVGFAVAAASAAMLTESSVTRMKSASASMPR